MTTVFTPQDESELVKGIKDYFNTKTHLQQNYSKAANANWGTVGAIENWNVSKIKSMKDAFLDRTFTEDEEKVIAADLSNWNLSNVTDMSNMFKNAKGLNNVKLDWNNSTGYNNTSKVTNMSSMFYGASDFNKNISTWDVSKVTNMSYMFYGATVFNQNISTWDISKVTNMSYMFYGATKFNQYISNWQTTAITTTTTISNMFTGATLMLANSSNTSSYNYLYGIQPTATPTVSTVFNKRFTPYTNGAYTANLMFKAGLAYYFGGNISGLSNYGYTNSTIATAVIGNYSTNPTAIKNWVVFNVTDMTYAFQNKTDFNQNIRYWCIDTIYCDVTNMFDGATKMLTTYSSYIINNNTPNINTFFYVFTPQSNTEFTNGLLDYFSSSTSLSYAYSSSSNAHINIIGKYNTTPSIISRWNVSKITSMKQAFYNKTNFNEDISTWNVSNVTDMSLMFSCDRSVTATTSAILSYFNCDISGWDVSKVTTMAGMFSSASSFNQDLSLWNVAKVIDFSSMFYYAINFNQNISKWILNATDTININMNCMFLYAINFNQPLNTNSVYWNISRVNDMRNMFNGAFSFNQKLSNWNVSNVTKFDYMFSEATNFNQSLSNWNVSNVDNFSYMFNKTINYQQNIRYWKVKTGATFSQMFEGATNMNSYYSSSISNITNFFNPSRFTPINNTAFFAGLNYYFNKSNTIPSGVTSLTVSSLIGKWNNDDTKSAISLWDVSNVTDMSNAFETTTYSNAVSFNQDISNWNVSNVTDMRYMFNGASSFNQDISNWNVSNVNHMISMFCNATSFNQNISNWNVSKVINIQNMFDGASSFNQNISGWDVSNVENMAYMFDGASSFNQNISNWDVSKVENMAYMFANTNFNQNISAWNVISVRNFGCMFYNTPNFEQYLRVWPVQTFDSGSRSITLTNMFGNSKMITVYDDATTPEVSTQISDINFFCYNKNAKSPWTSDEISSYTFYNRFIATDTNFKTALAYYFGYSTDIPSGVSRDGDYVNAPIIIGKYNMKKTKSAITSWDVSAVTDMSSAFDTSVYPNAATFNQDISNWDVSKVTKMNTMFNGAAAFSQNIRVWSVRLSADVTDMFTGATSMYNTYNAISNSGYSTTPNKTLFFNQSS